MLKNERSQILRDMLLEVSPGHRSVIQLCDIEGLDRKDAAARLGMTISGLKTRLHRARKVNHIENTGELRNRQKSAVTCWTEESAANRFIRRDILPRGAVWRRVS